MATASGTIRDTTGTPACGAWDGPTKAEVKHITRVIAQVCRAGEIAQYRADRGLPQGMQAATVRALMEIEVIGRAPSRAGSREASIR